MLFLSQPTFFPWIGYYDLIDQSDIFVILDDVKFEKKLIDVKQVLSNKIEIETERQLQRFSKIYFNQVKINTNINEL